MNLSDKGVIPAQSEVIVASQVISIERRDALRSEMVDMVNEKIRLEQEKAKIMTEYKNKIKACGTSIVDTAKILHHGYEDVEVECTVMHDYDNRIVEYYDPMGVLVKTRKMRPDERTPRMI